MNHVLVTGASGFVGSALVDRLIKDDSSRVRVAVRRTGLIIPENVDVAVVGTLSDFASWAGAFDNINTVIHCAARVHIMNDVVADPLAEFRLANVHGTLNIAKQAAAAGVTRFIFISSIKVNGEETSYGRPYHANDKPNPQDPYGISKMEAEDGLKLIGAETGMEVVIIRPPLIYGAGVKANFQSIITLVARGYPWPIRPDSNKRSLVYVENLADLIVCCITHPLAANKIFLVADDNDYSTAEIVERISFAMNKKIYLFPCPRWFVKAFAAFIGKASVYERLYGNLQVDISDTKSILNWAPLISAQEAFNRTINGA